MGLTAAVAGASGYAGGELLRLLLAHPDLSVGPLAADRYAGRPVTSAHPHLPALADRSFQPLDPAALAADVVFLALPPGESAPAAAALSDDVLVVDLGADHRLADPGEWARFYGGRHAGAWLYGLPELPGVRAALNGARRVANPGCYPTAVVLALAPLLAAGLVDPDDLVVVAASGTSGAGRKAAEALAASTVMGDTSAYRVGGAHQHLPEIRQALAAAARTAVSLSFTPVLVPMPRGILATATARTRRGVDADALHAAFDSAYGDDEPFIRLLPTGEWPHTAATVGGNGCQLAVALDVDAGRAVVVAALDNLGKGAAGQAVQNANLALGLAETAGLTAAGVAP